MHSRIKKNNFKILFGENLKRIRKSKNLSFRQLAQRCDIDHSNLNKIEKGKINITLSTISELLKGLEIQPKELFDFDFSLENDE